MMESKNNGLWKWILLGVLLAGLFVAGRFLPLRDWMQQFTHWIKDHGALGMAVFLISYVAGAILFVPASLFILAAGIAFGLVWGGVIALTGAALGCATSFLIARHLARGPVEKMLGRHSKLRAFDSIIAEKGWKLVLLFRLTPFVPFPVSNYFWGITKIGFWPYLVASVVGIVPGTVLYTYLGYMGKMALDKNKGPRTPQEYALMGVGLIMSTIVVIYLTRLGKKSLAQMEQQAAQKKQADVPSV